MGIMSLVGNILGGSDAKRFARADELSVMLGEKEAEAQDYYKMISDENEATKKQAIADLKSLKGIENKEADLGSTILNTDAVQKAISSFNTATGQNIDFSKNKEFMRKIGSEANRALVAGINVETYTKNLVKSFYTDSKKGETRFSKFFDGSFEAEKQAKLDAQKQKSQQLAEGSRPNLGGRLSNIFNRKQAYKEQLMGEQSKIDPEVARQMERIQKGEPATTEREMLTTTFVNLSDSETRGLLKNSNVIAAGKNKVEPKYNARGDVVQDFTGNNLEGIQTARTIMQIMPFMAEAEYNKDEAARLYQDAEDITVYAHNKARKENPELYKKTPETAFNNEMKIIQEQFSKMNSSEKVEYIKELKKNKGKDIGPLPTNDSTFKEELKELVTDENKDQLGRKLITEGKAQPIPNKPQYYRVVVPETNEIIEYKLDRNKVVEWDYIGAKAESGNINRPDSARDRDKPEEYRFKKKRGSLTEMPTREQESELQKFDRRHTNQNK